jgi:hypothetical protein
MIVTRVREQVIADRAIAALYLVNGNDVKLPDVDETIARLDEMLASEPRQEGREEYELLYALGLRR